MVLTEVCANYFGSARVSCPSIGANKTALKLWTSSLEVELTAAPASGKGTAASSSNSKDKDRPSLSTRLSPSTKNIIDEHGVSYVTVLPRELRQRIELEAKHNKKPSN